MRLYKYYSYDHRKSNESNLAPLIHRTLRFSSPVRFNDVYDCRCFQRNLDGTISYEFTDTLSKHLQIASFSKNPLSPIMWAHYSSNHFGYVIEYEITPDVLVEVTYDNAAPSSFDTVQIMDEMIGLYPNLDCKSDEFIEKQKEYLSNCEKYQKILSNAIFVKHGDWNYEKEYRSLKTNADGFTSPFSDFQIADNCIKSLILGFRFDLKKMDYISKIVKKYFWDSGLKVCHVRPRLDKYEMELYRSVLWSKKGIQGTTF